LSKNALELQQGGFAWQTAGITGELAIGADHPVTGHDDAQGVAANGCPDRAHGLGVARLLTDPPITSGGTKADIA